MDVKQKTKTKQKISTPTKNWKKIRNVLSLHYLLVVKHQSPYEVSFVQLFVYFGSKNKNNLTLRWRKVAK